MQHEHGVHISDEKSTELAREKEQHGHASADGPRDEESDRSGVRVETQKVPSAGAEGSDRFRGRYKLAAAAHVVGDRAPATLGGQGHPGGRRLARGRRKPDGPRGAGQLKRLGERHELDQPEQDI